MSKTREALVKKYGSEKAYKRHMRSIRAMVKQHPKQGAFNDPEFARKASAKGVAAREAKRVQPEAN